MSARGCRPPAPSSCRREACQPLRTCAQRLPMWPGGQGTALPSWPDAADLLGGRLLGRLACCGRAPSTTSSVETKLCFSAVTVIEGLRSSRTLELSSDDVETRASRDQEDSRSESRVDAHSFERSMPNIAGVRARRQDSSPPRCTALSPERP